MAVVCWLHSSLPGAPSAVGVQRVTTAHLSADTLQPLGFCMTLHHGTSYHSTELLICQVVGHYALQQQPPTGAVVQTVCSGSRTLTFLLCEYGMHCLKTFLCCPFQRFDVDLKLPLESLLNRYSAL